ncbi:hypothetical protein XANCAGTX0491_004933 [Xanthoria calcicola]
MVRLYLLLNPSTQPEIICERYQQLLDASLPKSLGIKIEKSTIPDSVDFSALNPAIKVHPSNPFKPTGGIPSLNPHRGAHTYDSQVHGTDPLRSLQSSRIDPLVEQLSRLSFTDPVTPSSAPPIKQSATPQFVPATPRPTARGPYAAASRPVPTRHSSTSPFVRLASHPTPRAQALHPIPATPLHPPTPTAHAARRSATHSPPASQPQFSYDGRRTRAALVNSGIHDPGHQLYRTHTNIARSFWLAKGKEQAVEGRWGGKAAGISQVGFSAPVAVMALIHDQKERELRQIGRQVEHLFELYEILAEESRMRK